MSSPRNVSSPTFPVSAEPLRPAQQAGTWPAWLILAVTLLIRIPFLAIHPLQEDAYITLRSARHLAEYGDFSFNSHQHFPGTTSLLYPLIVAAFDLLSPSSMFLLVQLFGTFCVIGGCWFLARALCDNEAEQRIVWLLTACWPIALLTSYIGMASFDHYSTIEGYTLAPDQQRWFNAHYRLLRRFHYVPAAYHPSPVLQRILALGPIEDYLVFVRRDLSAQ